MKYCKMFFKTLLKFLLLNLIVELVSSYKFKNSKGMMMDFDYLVSQLYVQHCTFVEIGEGICSLFVELPMDASCRYKRSLKKQLYFGNCLCSEFRSWQLCSRQLAQQRPDDCVFEEGVDCPQTSARVHRRLCDITGMSQWNNQCNCSVPLADMHQDSLCGFRTCYVSPLPSAVCSPRSVCGTAHCDTSRHGGTLYSVKCDRKCKDHQPFCEHPGPATSVKRKVESEWSRWQPISSGDKNTFEQSVAECLDPQGNPAFDCLGPGLLCCSNEEGDCVCEVKQEDGCLRVFRYAITFSRSNDRDHNKVNVRSTGNKGKSNVWSRFLDVAQNEDGSDSLFAKQKQREYHIAINGSLQPAINVENNLLDNVQNIVARENDRSNYTTTQITLSTSETEFVDPVTLGMNAIKSNISSAIQPPSAPGTKYKTLSKGKQSTKSDEEVKNKIKEENKDIDDLKNINTPISGDAKTSFPSNSLSKGDNPNPISNAKYLATVDNALNADATPVYSMVTSKDISTEDDNDYDSIYETKNVSEVSTECVRFFQYTSGVNISEDISNTNNGSTKLQDSSNVNNIPKASETLISTDKQSNKKIENGSESKLTTTTAKIASLTNLNASNDYNKIITTERIFKVTTQTTSLKVPNAITTILQMVSKAKVATQGQETTFNAITALTPRPSADGATTTLKVTKVTDNKGEESKLPSPLRQNNKIDPIQILKSLDPILSGEVENKYSSNKAYDEPEPVLKDLDKDNVDSSVKEIINDVLGKKPADLRKENKDKGRYAYLNDDNPGNEQKDESINENIMLSHIKLKSKLLSDE